MDVSLVTEWLWETLRGARDSFAGAMFTWQSAAQVGALAVAGLVSWLLAKPARVALKRAFATLRADRQLVRIRALAMSLLFPLAWLLIVWFMVSYAQRRELAVDTLRIAASLLSAWVGIRIVVSVVRDPFWARVAGVLVWSLAALNILHLLGPVSTFLDSIAVNFGSTRFSAYLLIKAAILAAVLLWLAFTISALLQRRIERVPSLTPSVRVLIAKVSRFLFVALAVSVAVSTVGIDLSALALFGGAVGVGIGFGLQKVISNLVSGIILLLDASIKPGDVIEVGGTYGWVNSLGARYASVVTRDGTEYLIPNEDLITQQVVNWSYTNNYVRRRAKIGIHYKADLDLATRLVLESAAEVDRVLGDPAPVCLLVGFGDSSVDLELRFWIEDPQNGTANVADAILRRVWHKFREHGVEIPYPQRDLHLRSPAVVRVSSEPPPTATS